MGREVVSCRRGEVKTWPQKREGGPPETFAVERVRFSYSAMILLMEVQSHGCDWWTHAQGLLRRISHHDGQILKIEFAVSRVEEYYLHPGRFCRASSTAFVVMKYFASALGRSHDGTARGVWK